MEFFEESATHTLCTFQSRASQFCCQKFRHQNVNLPDTMLEQNHVFQKAQVTSNKMPRTHIKNHFWVQFFMAFHVALSLFRALLAPKMTIGLVEILQPCSYCTMNLNHMLSVSIYKKIRRISTQINSLTY